MHQVWKLSDPGDQNLGLAFADDGLLLGRTPLIESRHGSFVVRDRWEIESLLRCVYPAAGLHLDRL